jgi:hypothetical protein
MSANKERVESAADRPDAFMAELDRLVGGINRLTAVIEDADRRIERGFALALAGGAV